VGPRAGLDAVVRETIKLSLPLLVFSGFRTKKNSQLKKQIPVLNAEKFKLNKEFQTELIKPALLLNKLPFLQNLDS
jgi:hypothetical protein